MATSKSTRQQLRQLLSDLHGTLSTEGSSSAVLVEPHEIIETIVDIGLNVVYGSLPMSQGMLIFFSMQ